MRLGPNEISVNDVAGLRTVYAGGFEKGEWYSIFDNYGYIETRIPSSATDHKVFLACSPPGIPASTLRENG